MKMAQTNPYHPQRTLQFVLLNLQTLRRWFSRPVVDHLLLEGLSRPTRGRRLLLWSLKNTGSKIAVDSLQDKY